MNIQRKTILTILAFFAIYVIWGSTYLLNKIAVTEIPPLFLSSIRFIIAGILIFIIAKFLKLPLKLTKKQFLNNTIAGFLFLVYGNGVFVWALKYVDTGFAALEASLLPLVVLLLMRILHGKKIKKMSLIGVGFGIAGIYLLVSQQEIVANEGNIIGVLMILTCIVSWAFASVFVSTADMNKSYFVNSAYQMLIAGILLSITSLIVGESWSYPTSWSSNVKLSMILLVIFGSIIAFTAFNFLLKTVSPEKVATSSYVNPVIAVVLGWYVLDEQITSQTIIAAVLLLTGVYFINSKRNKSSV
jgi:drug/metabolite transporter (DMT)-like permease